MNTLEFTFEHKYTKTIRKAFGCNVWEAYKNAEISVEGQKVWEVTNVTNYYIVD